MESDILNAYLSGGLTGLLGATLSRVGEYLENSQKNAQEVKVLELQSSLAIKELDAKIAEVKAEAEYGRNPHPPSEEISAPPRTEERPAKEVKWLALAEVIRSVTRPFLTVLLCFMCFSVWAWSSSPHAEEQSVSTILYMGTTAVLWWFGSRTVTKGKS